MLNTVHSRARLLEVPLPHVFPWLTQRRTGTWWIMSWLLKFLIGTDHSVLAIISKILPQFFFLLIPLTSTGQLFKKCMLPSDTYSNMLKERKSQNGRGETVLIFVPTLWNNTLFFIFFFSLYFLKLTSVTSGSCHYANPASEKLSNLNFWILFLQSCLFYGQYNKNYWSGHYIK